MADPLSSLQKIVKLALRIKEAVDTVRHNREECKQIRTRAVRISSLLSRLPETGITGDPAMRDALADLEDALRHAHALVAACQQSSTVCLYCAAGKQARRLRRVQDDISQKVMLVVFATNIHNTIVLTNKNIRSGDARPQAQQHPLLPPPPLLTCSPPPAQLPQVLLPEPEVVRSRREKNQSSSIVITFLSFGFMHVPAAYIVMGHPQVFLPSSPLSSVIRNKVASAGIRLAAEVVAHSQFTPDSSTEMPEADDSGRARILELLIPTSNEKALQSKSLREFSFSELEAATHQFSVQNIVGSSSFATVYKGVLHDGLTVAVKKFEHANVLSAGNINVLHLVSKLEHKNIAKLIGYSAEDEKVGTKEDEGTFYLLVEEYMPNGSLYKTINDGLRLDWSSRFHLIQGIADGLSYLHERHVIHLDVKPSNILLDSDMNPKITDFGIAKVLNDNAFDFCSDIGTIEGTLGYMPPEYITDGTLSKKHDVYGFGVTLLDIVSSMSICKRATGQASIVWAWHARQAGGGMMELLDPSLFETSQLKEIERCVEVGLLCTQLDQAERPDMLDALEMLRGKKALGTPVRPGYTKEPAGWLRRWGCLRVKL